MTETQRVPAPRVPLRGHGEAAALLLVGIVILLIAKPWAPASSADPATAPWSTGNPPTTVPTLVEAGFAYDPGVFGAFEPAPEWSVWPGGLIVTLLYVTREAGPGPSAEPPGATPPASPAAPSRPGWPSVVTIGRRDHLLWLGLNTPITFTVRDATLSHLRDDGSRSAVPVVRLPTNWGTNFAVIGIPMAPGSNRLAVWPQGSYEVAVTLDPSGEMRTILVEVQTLEDPQRDQPDERPR